MKKVMIVGAGIGQVNLLKICQKRGYDVFVVSIPGDYPCFKLTNNIRYADILDKEAVLKIAQEENVDAVISDQNDMAVPTVAYVAEKMGLRGIGYETALKFTNKYLMRVAAQDSGIAVPKFFKAKNLDEAIEAAKKIGLPVIIKPVDGWSSRGVHKINTIDEISKCFKNSLELSISKETIVEDFIEGDEYLVDGFSMDYQYTNLDLGIKEKFDISNIFVSSMCMFMSAKMIKDHVGLKILEANKELVSRIGFEFGITHGEYLYNKKEDKVYLVEIAARGGGIYLSSHITPSATGFNTNEALIDYVVEGLKVIPNELQLSEKVSAWKCFALPEGEIISIAGIEETKKINGVILVDMKDVYIGKKTTVLANDNGKCGPVLIVADNQKECKEIIKKIKETLKIFIKTSSGVRGVIW